jgi:hypothetical protein
MPDSKEFGLSDYATLSIPFVGDLLWAIKRKLSGQNDLITAQDYAIRGDSHGISKIAPLLVAGSIASLGHHLPGMKPGYKFRKALRPIIGRAGISLAGRNIKPLLLSLPAAQLTQGIISGEFTRRALQDKSASFFNFKADSEKNKQMANANLAASIGGGLAPWALSKAYMRFLVPSLYKDVPEVLDKKQKNVFDRFIKSKKFVVSDIAQDHDSFISAASRDREAKTRRAAKHLAKIFPNTNPNELINNAYKRVDQNSPFGALDEFLSARLKRFGPFFTPKDSNNILSNLIYKILKKTNKYDSNTKGFINMDQDFFKDLGKAGDTLKNTTLAHELGHGVGPRHYLAPGARGLSNLLPALAVGNILYTNDENTGRNTALLSPLLGAPLLASEIDASVRGSKILSKLTKGNISKMQKIAPFMGLPTYAAFAASPALTHLIKKNMGGYIDNNE